MENNFEKHIRETMQDAPDTSFDEKLWKDMESQLNREEKKPKSAFFRNIPLLLLALGASALAGFFYIKQDKAMKKIAAIEQQLQNQGKGQLTIDSTIKRHVTVIYDTIYNNVVIKQKVIQMEASKLNTSFFSSNRTSFKGIPDLGFFSVSDATYPTAISVSNQGLTTAQNRTFSLVQDKDTQGSAAIFDYSTPIDKISSLSPSYLSTGNQIDLPSISMLKKAKRKKRIVLPLQALKPTRFAIAGTTGSFTSLNLGGNGFNLRGSAQIEIGIGKRFGLIGSIEYFSNDFKKNIDPLNPNTYAGFPDIPPNSAEDVLTRINGDFNYLQIPFGIKYIVFPRKYFYPYIGLGVVPVKTAKSRLEYDYLSSTTGEYSVSRGGLMPRVFELNAVWSTIGFEVQLNRNWSLLLEGSSQFDIRKGKYKYENLNILKLTTGIQYEF